MSQFELPYPFSHPAPTQPDAGLPDPSARPGRPGYEVPGTGIPGIPGRRQRPVSQLAVPFRIEGGSAVTVPIDSVDAVAQNFTCLLDTFRGERLMVPEFGVEDPTFLSMSEAIDESELEQLATEWEPRAQLEFYDKVFDDGHVSVVCVVALRDDEELIE